MLLQADRVAFAYGPRSRAVDDVSLSIGPGALLGILGPNGSGKTTLLRLLSGTLKPNSGSVRLDGEDVSAMSRVALARRCAMVPQETQLAFEYSALEIVLMGRYPHLGAFEIEGPQDFEVAMAALEATGTRDLADRSFQHLSGGEKQRVVIASALAQLDSAAGAPANRVLFLDEPTASLDLRYQIELTHLIRRLHAGQGITIVLTTHDLQFAAAVCEDIVLLRAGKIIAQGPSAHVLSEERIAALYQLDVERLREFQRSVFSTLE